MKICIELDEEMKEQWTQTKSHLELAFYARALGSQLIYPIISCLKVFSFGLRMR